MLPCRILADTIIDDNHELVTDFSAPSDMRRSYFFSLLAFSPSQISEISGLKGKEGVLVFHCVPFFLLIIIIGGHSCVKL